MRRRGISLSDIHLHDQRETDMATTARSSTKKRVTQTSEVGKVLDLIRQKNIQVVDRKSVV